MSTIRRLYWHGVDDGKDLTYADRLSSQADGLDARTREKTISCSRRVAGLAPALQLWLVGRGVITRRQTGQKTRPSCAVNLLAYRIAAPQLNTPLRFDREGPRGSLIMIPTRDTRSRGAKIRTKPKVADQQQAVATHSDLQVVFASRDDLPRTLPLGFRWEGCASLMQ